MFDSVKRVDLDPFITSTTHGNCRELCTDNEV